MVARIRGATYLNAELRDWSALRATIPVKVDSHVSERHKAIPADHDVVEQVDVEEASCGQNFGREMQVVWRRRRIA